MASICVIEQPRNASQITLQALPPSEQDNQPMSTESTGEFLALEKWNSPRINIYRSFATFWCFLTMGANDAAYGVSAFIRDANQLASVDIQI